MRDEVLVALRTPILFVQGSRDALCPLPRLEAVRARMTAPSTLLVVDGGNHSLEVSAAAAQGLAAPRKPTPTPASWTRSASSSNAGT